MFQMFPKELKIFTYRNIPVSLTRGWFLFVAAFFLIGSIADSWRTGLVMLGMIVSTYFFVLLHEFGHSIAAQMLGYKVQSIKLMPWSGLAGIEGAWGKVPRHEFIITIWGPLVNVFLALTFFAISLPLNDWQATFIAGAQLAENKDLLWAFLAQYLLKMNLMLVFFNLIPIFPMDGGRILRAFLSQGMNNPRRATERVCQISIVVAIPVVLASIYFGYPLLCCMLPFMVSMGYKEKEKVFPSFAVWSNQNNRMARRNRRIVELRQQHQHKLNLQYVKAMSIDGAVESVMVRIINNLNINTYIDDSERFALHAQCLNLIAEETESMAEYIENNNPDYCVDIANRVYGKAWASTPIRHRDRQWAN
jgi:Zn-dependent protease